MEIQKLDKQQQQRPATNTFPTLISSSPLFTSMLDLQAEQPALQKQIGVLTQQITNLESRLSGRTTDSVAFSIKKAQLQSQKTAREEIGHREAKARLLTDRPLPAFT